MCFSLSYSLCLCESGFATDAVRREGVHLNNKLQHGCCIGEMNHLVHLGVPQAPFCSWEISGQRNTNIYLHQKQRVNDSSDDLCLAERRVGHCYLSAQKFLLAFKVFSEGIKNELYSVCSLESTTVHIPSMEEDGTLRG